MEIRLLQCDPSDPSSELHSHLPELNKLINDAYGAQDTTPRYGTEQLFSGLRIKASDQLVRELGSTGLAAIAFDVRQDDDRGIENDRGCPVAVACIKPWRGKAVQLWREHGEAAINANQISQGIDEWEVAMCASDKSPRYRGKGLVTRCLDALVEYLRSSRYRLNHNNADNPTKPIALWITVLEGVGTAEYWQRRGFVRQGDPDDAPAGLWGSVRAFKVGTLRRFITLDRSEKLS